MTEQTTNTPDKPALVLHLRSGSEPLLFALSTQEYESLTAKLPQLVNGGEVETLHTKNGSNVTVNFAHVAVAYLDDLQRGSKVFGLH